MGVMGHMGEIGPMGLMGHMDIVYKTGSWLGYFIKQIDKS